MNKIWTPIMILLGAACAFGQQKAVSVCLNAPAAAVMTVKTSTVSLTGSASGLAGVTKVTWRTSNGASGTASGTEAWRAANIPVAEGNTTIIVKAYDSKGASAWIALVAVREASATVVSSAATLPLQPEL